MQHCEKHNGILAEFESESQQNAVTATLADEKGLYWIGLTDLESEGKNKIMNIVYIIHIYSYLQRWFSMDDR